MRYVIAFFVASIVVVYGHAVLSLRIERLEEERRAALKVIIAATARTTAAQVDSTLIVEIDAYLTAYVKHEAFRQTVNDKTARSDAELRRLLGLDHPSNQQGDTS